MRSLSPDEAELWRRVTATIRPLSRTPLPPALDMPPEQAKSSVTAKLAPAPRLQKVRSAPVREPLGVTLDGSWDRQIKSGALQPDRVLDLHGHNLDRAWQAIDRGLERAIEAGERVVLLVTGHARPGDPPIERGKIRAAVYDWLHASRHAPAIASVRGAHRRHGGGGSLYIILRRPRR